VFTLFLNKSTRSTVTTVLLLNKDLTTSSSYHCVKFDQGVGMRFTISREKLQEGLAAVGPSIPAKTTLPVLANILLETTERGIRLSGTDLDIAVSTEVSADVETPGAITIPAKKLSEIARELPPAPVKIAAM